jgi:hypothetical protein
MAYRTLAAMEWQPYETAVNERWIVLLVSHWSFDHPRLFAIQRADGMIVAAPELPNRTVSHPFIEGDRVVYSSARAPNGVVDPTSWSIWEWDIGSDETREIATYPRGAFAIAVDGQDILAETGYGHLRAICFRRQGWTRLDCPPIPAPDQLWSGSTRMSYDFAIRDGKIFTLYFDFSTATSTIESLDMHDRSSQVEWSGPSRVVGFDVFRIYGQSGYAFAVETYDGKVAITASGWPSTEVCSLFDPPKSCSTQLVRGGAQSAFLVLKAIPWDLQSNATLLSYEFANGPAALAYAPSHDIGPIDWEGAQFFFTLRAASGLHYLVEVDYTQGLDDFCVDATGRMQCSPRAGV